MNDGYKQSNYEHAPCAGVRQPTPAAAAAWSAAAALSCVGPLSSAVGSAPGPSSAPSAMALPPGSSIDGDTNSDGPACGICTSSCHSNRSRLKLPKQGRHPEADCLLAHRLPRQNAYLHLNWLQHGVQREFCPLSKGRASAHTCSAQSAAGKLVVAVRPRHQTAARSCARAAASSLSNLPRSTTTCPPRTPATRAHALTTKIPLCSMPPRLPGNNDCKISEHGAQYDMRICNSCEGCLHKYLTGVVPSHITCSRLLIQGPLACSTQPDSRRAVE